MVNVGLGWSSFVGIILAAAGLALYFLRSLRPKLARDHDIFFAAVALLCGGILFFQGWRQDPILQFGQFLLTGTAIFFAVESIRLRGAATEQARQNAPIVDKERPVSRVYEAKLDEYEAAFDDRSTRPRRRIRGSEDERPSRNDYDEMPRRRPAAPPRANLDDRYSGSGRRSRPPVDDLGPQDYSIDNDVQAPRRPSRPSRGSAPASRPGQPTGASRTRRPSSVDEGGARPSSRDRRPEPDIPPSEYVDYRPIDNEDEVDNWGDE